MPQRSVIVGVKRSPMGKFLGTLATLTAPDIGAAVARKLLEAIGCPPDAVDMAIVGEVLQAGVGQNPARQVALGAGLPDTVTAITVNQVCGSGMRAVMDADNNLRLGQASVVLAGGIESMSNAPHYVYGLRTGAVKFGDATLVDGMLHDGLTCAFEGWAMGCAADYVAEEHGINRQDQDAFAVESHRRAAAARNAGAFKSAIAPIDIRRKKETFVFDEDETIRSDATIESLAKLRPAFDKNGTVTAGNASQLADGAAMALLASKEEAARRGWKPRARILAHTTFGVAPKELFMAPVGAIRQAVKSAELKLGDIDLFEINEAFAAQAVACMKTLEINTDRVNVYGGGIALGHPIGVSGTRILGTLIDALEQRDAKRGVASLCLGGGNAVAMVIERP
ncbi:MAG: thiolase family protein [Phycisphaerae bacterium]